VVSGLDVVNKIARVATTRDKPNEDVVLTRVDVYRQ
jgi:peptidyl-prolyl cis-trans isomerase A (cyclophilin A)